MASGLVHPLHQKTRKTVLPLTLFVWVCVFVCVSVLISFFRVTLTLETVTLLLNYPQSFLSRPLHTEGERMEGVSLDTGEKRKRGR